MRKIILIFCLLTMGLSAAWGQPEEWGQQVHRQESLYNTIFVYQRRSIVTLRFGRRSAVPIQTQVDLDDLRRHQLEYTELSFCGLLYQSEPKRVLVLGLGGGVIPRDLRYYYPDAVIDIAEIDEAIVPVAKKYFAFAEDEKMKVHVDDGRMFIKKQLRLEESPRYDLIILDAFNGDYIPFHLMTQEFLEEVKAVLAPEGVVVANVFYDNLLFDAEWVTFLAVFEHCQVFMGKDSGNAMLVSTGPAGRPLEVKELVDRARALHEKRPFAFSLISIARCIKPALRPDSDAKVLTDDRAPVDWLRDQQKKE
jgi:spermidine synthase